MLDVARLCGGTSQSKEFRSGDYGESDSLRGSRVAMRGDGIHALGVVGSGWLLTSFSPRNPLGVKKHTLLKSELGKS